MKVCVRFFLKKKLNKHLSGLQYYWQCQKKKILTRNFLDFFTVVWFSDCVALPEKESLARKEGKSEQECTCWKPAWKLQDKFLILLMKLSFYLQKMPQIFCNSFPVTKKINCKGLAWVFSFFWKVPC